MNKKELNNDQKEKIIYSLVNNFSTNEAIAFVTCSTVTFYKYKKLFIRDNAFRTAKNFGLCNSCDNNYYRVYKIFRDKHISNRNCKRMTHNIEPSTIKLEFVSNTEMWTWIRNKVLENYNILLG